MALLLTCTAKVLAQGQGINAIDSMLQALSNAHEDTNKVSLLNNVSYALRAVQPTSGINYGNQALTLAQKLTWKKGIADACYALGYNYLSKNNYGAARSNFQKAVNLYRDLGDRRGRSNTLIGLGDIFREQGNYSDAEIYYNSADSIKEAMKDNQGKAYCYTRMGSVYELRGNYPKALEYDLVALSIFEKSGDKHGVADNLENIGAIYQKLGDYSNAQDYYTRALGICEQMGFKTGIANCLEKSGTIYQIMGNYAKALDCYNKALFKYDALGDKLGNARILTAIGNTYAVQGNYPRALGYDFKSLSRLKELDNKSEMAGCMVTIGVAYKSIANATNPVKRDEYVPDGKEAQQRKALAYIDSALAIDLEIGDLYGLQQCYKERSDIEEMMGNYSEANQSYKQHVYYRDSLFNKEKTREEAQREAEFRHKGIEDSLKEQKLLSDAELIRQTLTSEVQHSIDSSSIAMKQLSLQKTESDLELQQSLDNELKQKTQLQEINIEQKNARIRQQRLISYVYIAGIAALLLISFFVYRSFTVQKKLNKVITQLISEREKTIEERTAELRIANTKLIELIQFNAHNIREPLSRIMGTMNLREYVSDEEFMENYWKLMEKSVNDLDNTIKHVIFSAENSTNDPGK